MVFELFDSQKEASFGALFGPIPGSILAPFWGSFWAGPKPGFWQSWGWPGQTLGPGVENFHPQIVY